MPVKLLSETSKSLNPGAFIFLYTLDCSSLGGPILRWANCCEEDGSPVQFGGIEYPPMNFAAEGFTWEGDTLPRPKITTSVPWEIKVAEGMTPKGSTSSFWVLTAVTPSLRLEMVSNSTLTPSSSK